MGAVIFFFVFFGLLLPMTWFFEETKVGVKTWHWLEVNVFHDED